MKGKMTVYEMIQELAQYPADQLIEVNVYADGFGVEVKRRKKQKKGTILMRRCALMKKFRKCQLKNTKSSTVRE